MVPQVHCACGCYIRNHLNGLMSQEDSGEPIAITGVNMSEPGVVVQGGKCFQVSHNPEKGRCTNGLASLTVVSSRLSW